MRDLILQELKKCKRPGIDNLIKWLEGTDYFTAPCSTQYHLCIPGGLAKHSHNVYELLKEKNTRYELNIPEESIIICGLLHDVCKIGLYYKGTKWRKDQSTNWEWRQIDCWMVNDQLPLGHGAKSVMMLQHYVQLSDEEMSAITWHLGYADPGIHFKFPNGYAFEAAVKKYPLAPLLISADYEASHILEREVK